MKFAPPRYTLYCLVRDGETMPRLEGPGIYATKQAAQRALKLGGFQHVEPFQVTPSSWGKWIRAHVSLAVRRLSERLFRIP
jgi:hypothetical protein